MYNWFLCGKEIFQLCRVQVLDTFQDSLDFQLPGIRLDEFIKPNALAIASHSFIIHELRYHFSVLLFVNPSALAGVPWIRRHGHKNLWWEWATGRICKAHPAFPSESLVFPEASHRVHKLFVRAQMVETLHKIMVDRPGTNVFPVQDVLYTYIHLN